MDKETELQKEFFVPTVDGNLVDADFSKSIVLFGEYIVTNRSFLFTQGDPALRLAQWNMATMKDIVSAPESSTISNLSLGNDLDKTIKSLTDLWKATKLIMPWLETLFIVETTPRRNGADVEKLQEIQMKLNPISGIKLSTSWSPSRALYNNDKTETQIIDQTLKELHFEIKNTVKGCFFGALGTIDFRHKLLLGDLPPVSEVVMKGHLMGIIQYLEQQEERKPLVFVRIHHEDDLKFLTDLVPSSLQQQFVIQMKLFIDKYAKAINDEGEKAAFKEWILKTKDASNFKFSAEPDFRDTFTGGGLCPQTYQHLLQCLLEHLPGRLLLSNCTTTDSYLQLFGYEHVLKAVDSFKSGTSFWQEYAKQTGDLLKWKMKVVEVVIEGPKYECQNCRQLFDEEKHTPFEKMQMQFCSMKCISAYRKAGGFNK